MKIPERQDALDWLSQKYLPDGAESKPNGGARQSDGQVQTILSDEEIIALCRKAKNAAKFSALFDHGDTAAYDGDDSRADQALASLLAFYTQDREQLDRLFRRSALMRPKWDERRGASTYGRRTIDRALAGLTETYRPRQLANGGTANDSYRLEEEPPQPGLAGRILIGERLAGGVEPPEELLPGILLAGKIHKVFSGPGTGKSFLALWATLETIRRGKTALYFDAENGASVITERMEDLGADPTELDARFHFYPSPDLTMDSEAKRAYETTLEEVRPDLAVFDSWVDFLTIAGLEENSATEVTNWVQHFAVPARERGIAVLLLDHVPTDANRSRGSTQKLGKVDVSWRLKKGLDFDRRRVGQIELQLEKDREGWLPEKVRFAVGGGETGFVFRRDVQVFERRDPTDGLTDSEQKLVRFLQERGDQGARWKEMLDQMGSKATLHRALSGISSRNLVSKEQGRYYARTREPESPITKGDSRGSARFHEGSAEPSEPDTPGRGSGGSTPLYRGGTAEPRVEPNSAGGLSVKDAGMQMRRANSGPAKALAAYLEKPNRQRLEYLTKAVLVARGQDTTGWEAYVGAVEEAANDPSHHPLDCECGCL